IRKVEFAADRGPEIGPEHRGEGIPLVRLGADGLSRHVSQGAEGEPLVQPEQEVHRLERKVYELATQVDPAVTRAVEQVAAEQLLDVRQDPGLGGGVQPVAAVVEALEGAVETAGVAPNNRLLLDDGHAGLAGGAQLPGGADAGGAGAEDDDMRFSHARDECPGG